MFVHGASSCLVHLYNKDTIEIIMMTTISKSFQPFLTHIYPTMSKEATWDRGRPRAPNVSYSFVGQP